MISYQFANGVESITGEVVIDADQLGILLSALSICAGAQFKALLMLDLKEAAQKRAARQSKRIGELTWGIPQDILETRLGENRDQALAITNVASELRVRLAGRPHMLQSLITREIHGRDYIECAQQEKNEPLLLLVS